jgi:nitrate/TMAO reductase-like tetraheme cytochrome c subunit
VIVAVTVAMIGLLVARPGLAAQRGGKAMAFIPFFILPVLVTWFGTNAHMERAKETKFCLGCHVMEPYGKSLHVDDQSWVPAAHFQNNRIPRDAACFTCHTTYTMFGDYAAKLKGIKHTWIYYLGTIPKEIKLYEPFRNRECLHCHGGSRKFEANDTHSAIRADLESNKTSCLECHNTIHNVQEVDKAKLWQPTATEKTAAGQGGGS